MTDIEDYQTVVSFQGIEMLLKGSCDGDPRFDTNPPYWLNVRVSPNPQFCGETELYVQKDDIADLIENLTRMHRETKGGCTVKCAGWGSYVNFEVGKSGELCIDGLLNKRWDEDNNHLRFKLISDQTVIPHIIAVLEGLIADR